MFMGRGVSEMKRRGIDGSEIVGVKMDVDGFVLRHGGGATCCKVPRLMYRGASDSG